MKKLLLAIAISALVGACGIQKTAEDTHHEVQLTNVQMGQTLREIQKTNEQMAKMLAELKVLKEKTTVAGDNTGDVAKTTKQLEALTEKVRALTERLVAGMGKTNDGVELQKLGQVLASLTAPSSIQILTPPAAMMPWALKLAEYAPAEQLLQIAYTFLASAKYGIEAVPGNGRSRLVALRAGSAVAAFATDQQTNAILKAQVDGGGEYVNAAYEFGAVRFAFLREFLLEPLLDASKTPTLNVAILKKAAGYFRSLKVLAELPYASRMTLTIEPSEKQGEFDGFAAAVSAEELRAVGKKAKRRFDKELTEGDKGRTDVQALLKAFDL